MAPAVTLAGKPAMTPAGVAVGEGDTLGVWLSAAVAALVTVGRGVGVSVGNGVRLGVGVGGSVGAT